MLPCLERKFFPPLMISFSSLFQKPVLRGQGHFEMKRFFGIFFVLFLKIKGIYGKTFFLCQKFQAGGPSCNLNVQRSIPRKNVFEKQVHKRQLGQKIQTIGQKFRQGCQSSIQRHHKNNQWEEKNFTISFVSILVFGLGRWIFEFWFRIQA